MISDAMSETMLTEYEMLKNLQHPNIMKTYDLIYDHKKFNLVTELFEGGDLFEKLEIQGTIPQERAKSYLFQILSAMTYCHLRHIVHRDLKPENIMFKTKDPDSSISLLDFGSANVFHIN
jgi:serine/threonine protein kinase